MMNGDLARIFGTSDVTIDNSMPQHPEFSKHGTETITDLVIECDRTESTAKYLASGRRFANLETKEIKRGWIEATRTLVSYGRVN